jgi:hypothetical protein
MLFTMIGAVAGVAVLLVLNLLALFGIGRPG